MSMKLFRYITLLSLTGILMACSGASENSEALSLIDTSRDPNSTGTEITPDTTVPTKPTNLLTTSVATNAVQLQWTASTDNVGVSGYRIYRNSSLLNTVTGTSFQDSTVTANTSYQYYVTAFDAANNTNSSDTLTVNTPASTATDTTSPSVPSGLTAITNTATSVEMSWNASTDNVAVTRYYIYRDSIEIASTTTSTFTDNNVQAGTAYQYSVAATDAAGNLSLQSSILSVTTPIVDYTGVATLSWQPPLENTDGSTLLDLSGYKIYYGETSTQLIYTITITNPGLTTYVIDNLMSNTTYYFTITALNSQNIESDFSNIVSKLTNG